MPLFMRRLVFSCSSAFCRDRSPWESRVWAFAAAKCVRLSQWAAEQQPLLRRQGHSLRPVREWIRGALFVSAYAGAGSMGASGSSSSTNSSSISISSVVRGWGGHCVALRVRRPASSKEQQQQCYCRCNYDCRCARVLHCGVRCFLVRFLCGSFGGRGLSGKHHFYGKLPPEVEHFHYFSVVHLSIGIHGDCSEGSRRALCPV